MSRLAILVPPPNLYHHAKKSQCYLPMLGGYEKMIKNWAWFQVEFQVEYLKVLCKIIPYLKHTHYFSLNWKLVTSNYVLFIYKKIDIRVLKSTKVKVSNYCPMLYFITFNYNFTKILLNLSIKCWNSTFNAQGSRIIIVLV
jgi:hypothetical protein